MNKILILDANQRSALAATRALGKKGIAVITGDTTPRTLAGSSKYSQENITYPSPYEAPDAFVTHLAETIQRLHVDALLPMTDVTTAIVLKHHAQLAHVRLAAPSFEIYDSVTDKYRLFQTAQKLGLTMPTTQFVDPAHAPWVVPDNLRYPVVLKPARSRILTGGHWLSTAVKVAHTRAGLNRIISDYPWFQHSPFLVQEFIHGQGQGIFALYDHGRPVCFFAHKRLREKPPEGGVSVLSESAPVAGDMRHIAEALLTPIGWHGVAMVEFKVASDGTPYLMEINGRFWGSLQLAIDAGVDFPYLVYQLAMGQPAGPVNEYKIGVKSRWLLGDLDHLYLKLKAHRQNVSLAEKLRSIARFCIPYQRGMRYEINRLDDLGPFLFELRAYVGH